MLLLNNNGIALEILRKSFPNAQFPTTQGFPLLLFVLFSFIYFFLPCLMTQILFFFFAIYFIIKLQQMYDFICFPSYYGSLVYHRFFSHTVKIFPYVLYLSSALSLFHLFSLTHFFFFGKFFVYPFFFLVILFCFAITKRVSQLPPPTLIHNLARKTIPFFFF